MPARKRTFVCSKATHAELVQVPSRLRPGINFLHLRQDDGEPMIANCFIRSSCVGIAPFIQVCSRISEIDGRFSGFLSSIEIIRLLNSFESSSG